MRATRKSWNHLPAPTSRGELVLHALFTEAEAEQLRLGLVPEQMEDKWFVYFEDGWLRFHRSWTGAFIYALRLDDSPAGVRVTESWVNRDPSQYTGTDTEYDRRLVQFIIDAFLLKNPGVTFPRPASRAAAPGGVQHAYVGRGYPEKPPGSSGAEGGD